MSTPDDQSAFALVGGDSLIGEDVLTVDDIARQAVPEWTAEKRTGQHLFGALDAAVSQFGRR